MIIENYFSILKSPTVEGFIFRGLSGIGLFVLMIIIGILRENRKYTYSDSETRVHKKTGQLQKFYSWPAMYPSLPARSRWINIKNEEDGHIRDGKTDGV